jgi:hypothetical protein
MHSQGGALAAITAAVVSVPRFPSVSNKVFDMDVFSLSALRCTPLFYAMENLFTRHCTS